MKKVKVAILGAGSAGLSARSEVAKATDDYLVIDPGPLGTTCARVGCMPSKALIDVANDFHRRHGFAARGITGAEGLAIDWARALAHVAELRDGFVASVLDGMEPWGDRLITAPARFVDAQTLDVGGERIHAERVVIATGSRPIVPDEWTRFGQDLLDTDTLFDLDTLPRRMAVIGLGAVGLELGQALARLGVEVLGIDPSPALGGLTSPALQDVACDLFAQEFDLAIARAHPSGLSQAGIEISAGETQRTVDKALLAIGRAPVIEGLDLDKAGVTLDLDGLLPADPHTLRIEGTAIFAAGDVLGRRAVLHEAADEGRIAGFNAVQDEDQAFARRPSLAITFCDPNIAIIGRSHKQLSDSGTDFETGQVDFTKQGRARVKGENRGCAEVYLEPSSGQVLGAELIAPGGEHLAHLLASMMAFDINAQDILKVPIYHPVLEEGLRTALRRGLSRLSAQRRRLDLWRCDEPPVGS